MPTGTLTDYKQIATTVGISVTFVKAIAGLSKPARHALLLQLNSVKQELKGQLSTFAYKARIAKRKQIEINKIYTATGDKFSQVKRIMNLLNFGPDFKDTPEVQNLINLMLSNAKIQGVSLGGYKDVENIINAINFKAQQAARAVDFAEIGVRAINSKIDEVDKYLNVLNAVDVLR